MGGYDGSIKIDSNINSKGFNSGINSMINTVGKLGKVVIAAFSIKAITNFVKASVDAASELSNSFTGLKSILDGQGKSFSQAKNYIEEYISDGLVSATEATTAYKNLAARGYNTEQIEKVMTALKDSATFGRQSSYTLGEAVQSASEGLKNENSILVDNAGVTKNVAKMWEDYAKSIGKTTSSLTQQEKIQAEVNGILEETKFQAGDSEIYLNTYSGQLARLNASFTNLKQTVGNIFIPIFQAILPYINAVIQGLTKVAKVFSSVVQLIFGKTASTTKNLATNTSNAAEGISSLGSAAEKAGKQAKGALASFDDLNVLTQDTSSSSSTSSGGSDIGSDIGNLNLEDTEVGSDITISPVLYEVFNIIKELANITKDGFNISFNNSNFEGLLNHLNGIKETLIDIWTDPNVLNSAGNWAENVSYALGQVAGSIARTGINIAENLIGSIDTYLSQNSQKIKDFIISMFDISGENISLIGNLYQALGEISDVFKGDTAKQIGADIIAIFSNPLMDAIELCAKFVTDISGVFFQPIIDNSENLKNTFKNLLTPIEKMTGKLSEAFTYVGEKWNEVYDTYMAPFMDSLKTGLSDTLSKFLDYYNQYVVPFVDGIAEDFGTLWEEHIKPLADKANEFMASSIELTRILWENCLKPMIDWIIKNILPVLLPIFQSIWNTIKKVFGSISDIIGGFIDTLKGLIDFAIGIFTGDWNKAWEGIKTFFKGTWDTIKGIVETVWNLIVGIIETVTSIIGAKIKTVLAAIKEVWNTSWTWIKNLVMNIWNSISTSISKAFNGVKNTISNILSSIKTIWNNIWKGLKTTVTNIFNGIWGTIKKVINSILGGIEGMANGVIKGINKVTSAMNNLSFDIPDWVPSMGGKKFGFNIKQLNTISIPKLATGAVIPPNQEFLAVLGDQKKGRNLEAPEDLIRQIVREESNNNDRPIIINATFELEGTAIGRKIIEVINKEQEAAGKTLLKI